MAPSPSDLSPFAAPPDAQQNRISPSAFYFTSAENLRVTSYNALAGVQLTIRSRFLMNDGRIAISADPHTPTSARAAGTSLIVTSDGWLLGLEVFASTGTPITGQTYVIVEVVRGFEGAITPLCTLIQGYVTASRRLSYPGSPIVDSLDGAGALRSIQGTTPGAGAEISETVPTGARWMLLAFKALFTASGAAATRTPQWVIDDGTNTVLTVQSPNNTTAGLTQVDFLYAGPTNQPVNVNVSPVPFPATPLFLLAGYRIRTVTATIQGADQWSAVQYLVREWLEPLT